MGKKEKKTKVNLKFTHIQTIAYQRENQAT